MMSRNRRKHPPLDRTSAKDLALSYLARFSTSSAKLEAYLQRKIRERGVVEGGEPIDITAIVARMVELGYIDDEAYARARTSSLLRKGYGARRVEQTLRVDGIDEELREAVRPDEDEARKSALAFARKRGFGPFGAGHKPGETLDRHTREKQIASMLRAGHNFTSAQKLVDASSEAEAEQWANETEGRI